jgi:hypothetical protein
VGYGDALEDPLRVIAVGENDVEWLPTAGSRSAQAEGDKMDSLEVEEEIMRLLSPVRLGWDRLE